MRSIPAVREIHTEFAKDGVVVIGVHTPEFAHERDAQNVARAVKKRGIRYPVALDNSWSVWRAFGVHAWPTLIVLDRDGVVRYTHVGELHRGSKQWDGLTTLLRRLSTPPRGERSLPTVVRPAASSGDRAKAGEPVARRRAP